MAGYSGTPLLKKLGIETGDRVYVVGGALELPDDVTRMKTPRAPTDMTEDVVREVALPRGLVDNKVCAVDDVWSGLRLVVRKKNRATWPGGR